MRISDWSSDVCSSDLAGRRRRLARHAAQSGGVSQRRDRRLADEFRTRVRWCARERAARAAGRCAGPAVGNLVVPVDGMSVIEVPVRSAPTLPPEAPLDMPVQSLRTRSEEHTSELQSLMRISYAVFCLKKKTKISQTDQKL